jgi:ubiquinone/menaquinone biosynthesis C-methylase UbiE
MMTTKNEERQRKERAIWERLAANYDRNVMATYEEAYELSIQKTIPYLAADQQVLEIACGTGIIALGIAPRVKKVVGTDITSEMIAIARQKAEAQGATNVEFRVSDGYSLPFEDESFDCVLLFNILYLVKEPESLLKEAYRLLKPDGYLLSATDCEGEAAPLPVRIKLVLQKLLKVFGVIPYMRYYRKEDLHRLFEQASFSIVETDILHPAPVNYFIAAQKRIEQ